MPVELPWTLYEYLIHRSRHAAGPKPDNLRQRACKIEIYESALVHLIPERIVKIGKQVVNLGALGREDDIECALARIGGREHFFKGSAG